MQILNDSELTVGLLPGRVHYPKRTATLIVKGTFDLVPGEAARLAAEQLYTSGDVPFEDAADDSELRYESDFAFFKPAADLLLVGSCRPPRAPVRSSHVRFRVGDHERELRVFGDRELVSSTFRKTIRDPEPFETMPIRYSHAYGSAADEPNPVGRGAEMREKKRKSEAPILLPNVVDPEHPISGPKDVTPPAAFAPLGRMWGLRRSKAGTYDDGWLQQRWPWFPEDFDFAHFNAAPPEMQARGYLRGDESIELENLVAEHPRFECRLPGLGVRCFMTRQGESADRAAAVTMHLDTLWIDADALQLVLVWRGVEEVANEEFDDVDLVYIAAESLERPLSENECRERMAAALAPDADEEDDEEEPVEAAPAAEDGEPESEPEFEIDPKTQALFDEAGKTPEQVIAELAAAHPVEDEDEDDDEEQPERPWDAERLIAAHAAGEDLRELPLSALDLSGQDLSGADLSRSRLDGADLSGAKLVGAILQGCDLRKARLSETDLEGAVLVEAQLAGAVLERTRLHGADLAEIVAPGMHWNGVDLTEASMGEADLSGGSFTDCELQDCELEESDLRNSVWRGCRLFEADLTEARLDDASFESCDLGRCVIEGVRAARLRVVDCKLVELRASESADFSEALFERCEGQGSIWSEANLVGALFSGSTLQEADFTKIDGSRARFEGAELREARFLGATLVEARFGGANLFRAILEKADLTQADLSRTNLFQAALMEAELRDADLRGADTGMTLLETRGKTT